MPAMTMHKAINSGPEYLKDDMLAMTPAVRGLLYLLVVRALSYMHTAAQLCAKQCSSGLRKYLHASVT